MLTAATIDQTRVTEVDTEAGKTGVVAGAATATLNDSAPMVQLGNLQLRVARTAATASEVTVHAEVLPTTAAAALSPVGLAFKLAVTSAAEVNASSTNQRLQLTLDYSQIPLRYGGSFADRLTLYRVTPCAKDMAALAEGEAAPEPCHIWQALVGDNDRTHQQLTVVVTPTLISNVATTLPDDATTVKLYLPLISQAVSPAAELVEADEPVETDELYVLAAATSSQQGNYTATPLANIGDYQVSLSSGSAQTSYPVPLPPAAGDWRPLLR